MEETPNDPIAVLQRYFPHKVELHTYAKFSDAVDFTRERLGNYSEWQGEGVKRHDAYASSEWAMAHNFILFKDEVFATEVKLRYG